MQIENRIVVNAPIQKTWNFLLDPKKIGGCVPGVENVEVVDDTHFVVQIQVKVGFIKARFKVNLAIIDKNPPHYLKSQGAGDEAGMTSSLKQVNEVSLKELGSNQTEIHLKTDVNIFGKLGTFGHSVIKGKADKMWEEFAANLKKAIE